MPYRDYSYYTPNLSQGVVNAHLRHYLDTISYYEGATRSNPINKEGDCNGWSFLFAYYNSIHKGQQFKDILTYVSTWDGSHYKLSTNYGMPDSLKQKYANGAELFEHTINAVSWFSQIKTKHVTNGSITQDDRIKQFDLVSDGKHELNNVFSFLKNQNTNISHYELPDMLRIAHQWKNAWLDLGVYSSIGGHALSVYIDVDGKYHFYDCNARNGSYESYSPEDISSKILQSIGFDTKLKDFSLYQFFSKEDPKSTMPDSDLMGKLDISLYSANKFIDMAFKANQLDPVVKLFSTDNELTQKLVDQYGEKYLNKALDNNHVQLTELLLDKNVDVNTRLNYEGKTPLMVAAKAGNMEMTSLLVKHGAEISTTDYNGNDAISLAENNHHLEVVDYLSNPFLTGTYTVGDFLTWDIADTIYKLEPLLMQNLGQHNSSANVICMDDCIQTSSLKNHVLEATTEVGQSIASYVGLQLDNALNLITSTDIF